MSLRNSHKIFSRDDLILLPILGLAFYIAFIPHQNYPYPVHIDEWVHMANSEALLRAGSTTYDFPFPGRETMGLSNNLEVGFQLFWGIFQRISGISWINIIRYFPGVILMITTLSVYILGRRQGFGWEAALFASLIPTTVGIMGPAFLVPVSMGLLFTPLALFLAFNFKTVWSYVVTFIFICFLLTVHAPSAISMVIVLVPFILFNLKDNFKHSVGITLAVAIPFLAPFPWIFDLLLPTAQKLLIPQPLTEYVQFPLVIMTYGYLPIAIAILGILVLALKGEGKNYSLIFGLLALLVMLVIFFTFHYGISIMYERGLLFMMLMLSIVAGAGLMGVKDLKVPEKFRERLKLPHFARHVGYLLCAVLVGVTLAMVIPERQAEGYYHMIDDIDYEAFTWVKNNVDEKYEIAILDPWKATAFTAITGKKIYTRIHAYAQENDEKTYKFLNDGCTDTAFLKENDISIVYTRGSCDNPDLVKQEVEYIYLLKDIGENE